MRRRDGLNERDFPGYGHLDRIFRLKHGDPETTGWSPARRWRIGYHPPADWYEALMDALVAPGDRWIDIGGGHNVFPENPKLAEELVARSSETVAVDPSGNVLKNRFVHRRVQAMLEQFADDRPFDLASMRMVAEHIENPKAFAQALAPLLKPGGRLVILTVNSRSLVTLVSRIMPFKYHHRIKSLFWGGEEEDTFPTCYLLNTRQAIADALEPAGFTEERFFVLDDLAVFGRFKWLNYIEQSLWRLMNAGGVTYLDSCLLTVYTKGPRRP